MKITSVEKTKDNKMARIFIDDRYAFTIPHEEYIRNALYEQEEIDDEKIQYIRKNVLIHAARERAVRLLTIKDRSGFEMIKKLGEAGFDADVARSAAEELKTIGYLNDARFAMKYLTERVRTKAVSQKALRFELEQKGISSEIIEEVLSEFEIDDEEVALRAAKKKFSKYDISDYKVQKKVMNFLFHRGFSFEVGKRILKRMQG